MDRKRRLHEALRHRDQALIDRKRRRNERRNQRNEAAKTVKVAVAVVVEVIAAGRTIRIRASKRSTQPHSRRQAVESWRRVAAFREASDEIQRRRRLPRCRRSPRSRAELTMYS